MKNVEPPANLRENLNMRLEAFWKTEEPWLFRSVVQDLCKHYAEPRPKVLWDHKTLKPTEAGLCLENGTLLLWTPSRWRSNRRYRTMRQWINVFYHEFGHYLLWTDAERKANAFARLMTRKTEPVEWKPLKNWQRKAA